MIDEPFSEPVFRSKFLILTYRSKFDIFILRGGEVQMSEQNIHLIKTIQETRNLGRFKAFCEKNSTKDAQHRIRTIYSRTNDPRRTTKNIIINQLGETISDSDADRLFVLITSFLNKSRYRKPIEESIRKSLLLSQNHHCAICGCDIDMHAHVDHIVPFKFVGDELDNNLQMLCTDCNLKKNASLDYQIRFLLKLI